MNARQHGTHAGYWQHFKRDESICEPCREAYRTYQKQLRAKNPDLVRERDRRRAAQTRTAATRTNRRWTTEEDAVVLAEGSTNKEKALQLGRSQKSVTNRAATLRNPPPQKAPKIPEKCKLHDCEKLAKTRGMCPMHYQRFRIYGTPEPHGLNRLGCDCDVCSTARNRRDEELRERRRAYDAERKHDPQYQSHTRERARARYNEDEEYRARVLEWQKKHRRSTEEETEYTREWKRKNPEKWRDLQKRMIERSTERNRESRPHAHNHFKEWTGPELEMVAREDLSLEELSKTLGRTLAAVTHARTKVWSLPREVLLAGISRRQLVRQHGTNAGYWQHYKRGEDICGNCREAHREHDRKRWAAKKSPR